MITDVYPSREEPIEGVSGQLISDVAKEYGHRKVHYVEDKNELPARLKEIVEPGDVVITMGAGDIYKYGEQFVDALDAGISKLKWQEINVSCHAEFISASVSKRSWNEFRMTHS